MQAQAKQAESLIRLYDNLLSAAEALKKLAGEELRGAQAEHLEDEAAAQVRTFLGATIMHTCCVSCIGSRVSDIRTTLKTKQLPRCRSCWLLL